MISILSLLLGLMIIGLLCTFLGVALSLIIGILGMSSKKLGFKDSFEAAIESLTPSASIAAILTVPSCYTLLTPKNDIPAFLFYANRFGDNNDIKSGLAIFLYIFVFVFAMFYIVKIKDRFK